MSVAQSMTSPPQSLASFRSVWSRRPQNSMSIEYLIRSTAFDPEAVNAVLAAYGRLGKALTLADGDDCANWSVATKIVGQVWLEERDPDWMCRQVLKELGSAGSWSFSRVGLSTNHCAPAGCEVTDEKVTRSSTPHRASIRALLPRARRSSRARDSSKLIRLGSSCRRRR
jgi:hypothetical protein